MSISLLEHEIARFLRSREPEVICIRGKWGVGKTYSWNAFLKEAKDHDAIGMKYYAYVSLFGIDSLERLKYAIFENTLATCDIGLEPSVETFKSNTMAVIKQLGMKSLRIIASLPLLKNYASASQFEILAFLSVRDRIVCIDDLERKGNHLPMKDVMGLISHLREQKKCKVVLILNDDQLTDSDKESYELYNEKVIDSSLLFEPDPSDCVRIAIKGADQAREWLRSAVISLRISNIRHIKKIERLVLRAVPLLEGFHPQILYQAVHSLTLLTWSFYSKGTAPPLEFILHKYNKLFRDNKEFSDDEKRWHLLLEEYNFGLADEFDLLLLDGIKRGFFDEASVASKAEALQRTFEATEAQRTLTAAWELYHGSFDDNEEEVVNAISDAYRQNVRFVSPANLNAVVDLLKELGRPEAAGDIVQFYMEEHGKYRDLFDLSKYPFARDVTDPDVRAAFEDRYRSFKDERRPLDVLLRIGRNKSWYREDVALLLSLSADDFYRLFKECRGDDLRLVVNASLLFRGDGPDEDMKKMTAEAEEALVRVGRDSLINRLRVQHKYGVKVDD